MILNKVHLRAYLILPVISAYLKKYKDRIILKVREKIINNII